MTNSTDGPRPQSDYDALTEQEAVERIRVAREKLGDRLLILGHHYQQDSVIQFADLNGDSYALATKAAKVEGTEFIIFCGVHFMAESADILTPPGQIVILPDLAAGCTMADMANLEQVEQAWEEIHECTDEKVIPITYVNSSADLKNFVGRNGGSVCTSSNARAVIEWAFGQGSKILFFPDQHLGRNTCAAMGIPLDEMLVWEPDVEYGGNTKAQIAQSPVMLWDGYCSVHMGFSEAQAANWRKERPNIQIIVHPECRYEVVQAADYYGSTAHIIKMVSAAEPGSEWAVGTEINLVNRLQTQFPDRFVTSLSPYECLCSTMYRIRPQYLCWAMESLVDGHVVNQISVPDDVAEGARLSLARMIEITQG